MRVETPQKAEQRKTPPSLRQRRRKTPLSRLQRLQRSWTPVPPLLLVLTLHSMTWPYRAVLLLWFRVCSASSKGSALAVVADQFWLLRRQRLLMLLHKSCLQQYQLRRPMLEQQRCRRASLY